MGQTIFLFFLLLYPVVHYLVFYIGVNFNSVLFAFQRYDINTGAYYFIGFENFGNFFRSFVSEPFMLTALKNSFIMYAVGLFISTPITIATAYCIFKKIPMSEFFRVVVFLPSVISSIVFVLIFRYGVDCALPELLTKLFNVERPPNLLLDTRYAFGTMLVYGIWVGSGTSVILYAGAMTKIDDSLIEYGKLEGIKPMRELFSIVLPMVFPTFTTFVVTGVAGLFTGSGAIFSFHREYANPEIYTLGYYFFIKVIGEYATPADYPYASAAGVIFTLVAAPVTLLVKWLLEHLGPNAEY